MQLNVSLSRLKRFSYLKRVFSCATVPMLRVDLVTVHASWQVNLNVTVNDGLYLVHGHTGGNLGDWLSRKNNVKSKKPVAPGGLRYGDWQQQTLPCAAAALGLTSHPER